MKTKLTVLAGALLLAFGGAAGAQDTSTPQQVPATPTPTESTTHGSTVSGVATGQQGQDSMAPPAESPGATVSEVAHAQRDWTLLDTDGDGMLSDAEIQADMTLAGVVDTYDTDADGQLSRAEFDAYVTAQATDGQTADVDTEFDSDLDGTVDPELDTDLTAGAELDLDEADVDADVDVDSDLDDDQ